MKRFLYVVALFYGEPEPIGFAHAFVQAADMREAYRLGWRVVRLPAGASRMNDYVIEIDDGAGDRNRIDDRTGAPPLPPGHPDRGGGLP